MSKYKIWRYCSILALFALTANAAPNIIVYTTKMYPVQNEQLATQIYYLDQVENFEADISQHLSKDPVKAEQEIQDLIRSPEWKTREQQLKEAYQGVINGWQNGIKKVPAVLFENGNGQSSVIYGTADIQKAKQEWEHWMQQNGGIK